MGTLDYISPEQAMDSHEVDIRADLYSLGCTLYFLLAGKVPFPGGEALQKLLKHRLEEPVPVERLRPDAPPGVAAVVRKLMAKRPGDRCQTPAEAAAALAVAASGPARTAPPADETVAGWSSISAPATAANTAPLPGRKRGRRLSPAHRVGAATGVVILVLGLVGLVRLLPRPADAPASDSRLPVVEPKRDPAAVAFDPWVDKVRKLPAEQQVQAVVQELKARNPGFDGKATHKVENGEVTSLFFVTDAVADLGPVRALAGLKSLACRGTEPGKGKVADLSPLHGMHVTDLNVIYNPVQDLSPLASTPLNSLSCRYTAVKDLSPLKETPLLSLGCDCTGVEDLSPLKDLKLTYLNCQNTKAKDLSPLKNMPLKVCFCDFDPRRDAEILRSITTLEAINGKPAAEFWKAVGDAPPGP